MNESTFQVGPGTWVQLRYSAFDEDGEPVEESAHEFGYVHGFGVLHDRLEASIEGLRAGDECTVTIPAAEAFGPRRDEAVLECDPSEFDPEVRAGDHLEAETADGALVILRVLEVRPDAVVVDTNHPLAGQRVRFHLKVLEVRPASAAELADGERRASLQSPAAEGPLIPLQSLLRGPSQRYETERSPETGPQAAPPGDKEI